MDKRLIAIGGGAVLLLLALRSAGGSTQQNDPTQVSAPAGLSGNFGGFGNTSPYLQSGETPYINFEAPTFPQAPDNFFANSGVTPMSKKTVLVNGREVEPTKYTGSSNFVPVSVTKGVPYSPQFQAQTAVPVDKKSTNPYSITKWETPTFRK